MYQIGKGSISIGDTKIDLRSAAVNFRQRHTRLLSSDEIAHAKIASAVYAVTDLHGGNSMGAFYLDGQYNEDDECDLSALDVFDVGFFM